MYTYIIKRMLMLFPTLFGAAVVVFLLLRLIPGDVCMLKFGGEGGYADPEQQVLVDRKGQKVRLKDCKVEALIYYS